MAWGERGSRYGSSGSCIREAFEGFEEFEGFEGFEGFE